MIPLTLEFDFSLFGVALCFSFFLSLSLSLSLVLFALPYSVFSAVVVRDLAVREVLHLLESPWAARPAPSNKNQW